MGKNEKNKTSIIAYSIFGIIFLLTIFQRYKGNNASFYTDLFQFTIKKYPYNNDIYIHDSLYQNSSILYPIVRILNINLDNDVVGITLMVCGSLIALYYLSKIILEYTSIKSNYSVLIILSLLITNEYNLLAMVQANPIYRSILPSTFAHYLIFPIIYYTLKNKVVIASILLAMMIGFNLKIAWVLSICIFIYFITQNISNLKQLLWFSIRGFVTISLYILGSIPEDFQLRIKLCELIILRNGNEDSINLQSINYIVLFIGSFPAYYYFSKKLSNNLLRSFSLIVLTVTAIFSVFGTFYTTIGYEYFPLPSLMLLSYVRSINIYNIFWKLIIFIYIISKEDYSFLFRSTLLLIIYFAFYSIKSIILVPLIIIGYLCISFIMNKYKSRFSFQFAINESVRFVVLIAIIMVLPTYSFIKKINGDWPNYAAFQLFNKWTVTTSSDYDYLSALKTLSEREDFILLPVKKISKPRKAIASIDGKYYDKHNGTIIYNGLVPDYKSNMLAGKSKFIGDFAHFYLNNNTYNEHRRRSEAIRVLFSEMENGNIISDKTLNIFRKNNVSLLVPNEFSHLFINNSKIEHINQNYSLIIL